MNLIERISVGAKGEATTVVRPEVTVRHFHPLMPEAYGTPFMIYLMEVAASNAVQSGMPEGWVTVGVEVNIRHMAATPVGRTVVARATVIEVSDRWIRFEVEAHDGIHTIGKGTHTRAPVELERFNAALAKGM